MPYGFWRLVPPSPCRCGLRNFGSKRVRDPVSKVVWLDHSLENVNVGDEIIADAIESQGVACAQTLDRITTHRVLNRSEIRLLRDAEVVFVGGTNILCSRILLGRQWPMPPWQIAAMHH